MTGFLIFIALLWTPSIIVLVLSIIECVKDAVDQRRIEKRLGGYSADRTIR